MPRLNGRIPAYRLHKRSGQAIVTLNGHDHYLGPHGTDVSKQAYDRLVAEWLATGRRDVAASAAPSASDPTINEVILAFWKHAQAYYVHADGKPTSELDNYRQALRPLRRLYGDTPASSFRPLALKALREHMIDLGWCRRNINAHIGRICRVFKWAASDELVDAAVHQGLKTVTALKRNRTRAHEKPRVRTVPEELINAIEPFVSRQVWAMIQIQLSTGARPGEIVGLRAGEIVCEGDVWSHTPVAHKTAHHGHDRHIFFGPQAQAILKPYLHERAPDDYLFSPAEAEDQRRQLAHHRRKVPLSCGNRPGTNRKASPKRCPASCYTVASYRRAIERGCNLAYPLPVHLVRINVKEAPGPGDRQETTAEWKQRLGEVLWQEVEAWRSTHRWSPHRLRKNAATAIRKNFGVESSKIVLGHSSIAVNELYAERDDEVAKDVVRRIG